MTEIERRILLNHVAILAGLKHLAIELMGRDRSAIDYDRYNEAIESTINLLQGEPDK